MNYARLIELTKKHEGKNLVMMCHPCGAEYSANPSDYYWKGPEFKCDCGWQLELAIKTVNYEILE